MPILQSQNLKKLLKYKYLRTYLLSLLILFFIVKLSPTLLQYHLSFNIFKAILITQLTLATSVSVAIIRYYLLLNYPQNSFWVIAKSVLLGFGLSILMPGRVGELMRPTYLFKHSSIPLQLSLTALGVEKILDLLTVCLLALFFISAKLLGHHLGIYLLAVIIIITPLFLLKQIEPLLHRLIILQPIKSLRNFLNLTLDGLLQSAQSHLLIKGFIITCIIWLIALGSSYLYFFIALGQPHLSFAVTSTIFILATIGGTIPLLPAGFGFFEAAVVFILNQHGYKFDHALVVAIGFHISQLLLTGILGFVIAYKERTGVSELLKVSINKLRQRNSQTNGD